MSSEVHDQNPSQCDESEVFENPKHEGPGETVEGQDDHHVRHDVQQHDWRWLRVRVDRVSQDEEGSAGGEGEGEVGDGHADDLDCGPPAGAENDVQLGQ